MVRTNSLVKWCSPYLPNPVIQGPNNAIKIGNHKTSKSHIKLHAQQNFYCFSTNMFTSETTAPQSPSPSHYQEGTWLYCDQFTITACVVTTQHAFCAGDGDPISNITVKNAVGKTHQNLTVVFWLFTLHNVLCSDSSEECTASFFRVTDQVQSDAQVMKWKNKCWLYVWAWQKLAYHNHRRRREAKPCPEQTGDKNSKKTTAGPQPVADLKTVRNVGGRQCSAIC